MRHQTDAGILNAAAHGCVAGYFPNASLMETRKLIAALKACRYDASGFVVEAGKVFRDWPGEQRLRSLAGFWSELVSGAMDYRDGCDPDVVAEFPAQRIVTEVSAAWDVEAWPMLWVESGGTLRDGMMVALKSDPIWQSVSCLGLPHPPFLPDSGIGVEDVDHAEAVKLGLLGSRSVVALPPPAPIAAASISVRLWDAISRTENLWKSRA